MATSGSSKRQRCESSSHDYEERDPNKPIIHPGQVITPIALQGTNIYEQLEFHGLIDFLSCDGDLDENMIIDFYQTLEIDKSSSRFVAYVNDKRIKFTEETFSEMFKLPSHGFQEYKHEAFPYDPPNFDNRDRYYMKRMDTHNHMNITYPWPHDLQILFRLIRRALFPTLRNVNDVSDWDKHIAYLILIKKPINFSKLFLRHIVATHEVKIGLPYGLALMKLFKHLKVPMRPPFSRSFEKSWRFDLATLQRMGLYRYKGNYLTQGAFDSLPNKVKVAIEDGIENDYTVDHDDQICVPSSLKDLADVLSKKIDDEFKKIHARIDALEARIG